MPAIQSIAIMPANTFTTSQSTDSPFYWSRATYYKRKLKDHPSDVGTKLQKLPACKVCGQPTQGHKKYKKKSFCPVKMMSPSKGLDNRLYDSYEQFTSVVESLEWPVLYLVHIVYSFLVHAFLKVLIMFNDTLSSVNSACVVDNVVVVSWCSPFHALSFNKVVSTSNVLWSVNNLMQPWGYSCLSEDKCQIAS